MTVRNWKVVVLVVVMAGMAPGALAAPGSEGGAIAGAGWEAWLGGLAGWWQGMIHAAPGSEVTVGAAGVDGSSDPAAPDDDPLQPPGGEAGPWGNPDGLTGGEGEAGPWGNPDGLTGGEDGSMEG